MKRFLHKVGLLTAAAMMLSSGVAVADDAQPDHGWMRAAPNDTLENFAIVGARTDNTLRRNQTLYWAIENDTGTINVIDTSDPGAPVKKVCTILDGTCASAPLFISASTSIICMDGELDATFGDANAILVDMRICSDSTCADNVSITGGELDASEGPGEGNGAGVCREFAAGHKYDGFNIGATWVFIEVTTIPADGETALVWVTGN